MVFATRHYNKLLILEFNPTIDDFDKRDGTSDVEEEFAYEPI